MTGLDQTVSAAKSAGLDRIGLMMAHGLDFQTLIQGLCPA
jgi:hypothetical protein